ncbi:hypothetical protein PG984_000295 [Apiospora sp. TS-2023a]
MDPPDEDFIRPLEHEALTEETIKLTIDLSHWITKPHDNDNPANVSDLDRVKQVEARFKCQESRKDAELLAKESILSITEAVLDKIPTAKSTRNPERLIRVVKYFIDNEWVPTTIVEKPMREFWDKEDLGTLVPLNDNSDCEEEEDIDLGDFEDPTKWKDLKTYVRQHDCIAQLMGHGLVKKPRYATAVFREASDTRRPKGDPFRKAAKAAAARYRYHAGKQLGKLKSDLDLDLDLEQPWSASHHTLWRPQCQSPTHHFLFRILPPCLATYCIIVYIFEGPFAGCPRGSLNP